MRRQEAKVNRGCCVATLLALIILSLGVSPSATGASYGYVGGGGAHYTTNKDTVGMPVSNEPPTVDAGPR